MSDYLIETLSNLTGRERHALKVAAVERRDACAARGDGRVADVFNALASSVADVEDSQRRTLEAMEDDLSPIVRRLTPEELADVRFDDEGPVEPPC